MKKSELRQIIREEIQKLHLNEEETLQWMIPMGWPDGMDCGFCYEQGCGCNLKTGCSDALMGSNCQNPDGYTGGHEGGNWFETSGVGDMWLDEPINPLSAKGRPNLGRGEKPIPRKPMSIREVKEIIKKIISKNNKNG